MFFICLMFFYVLCRKLVLQWYVLAEYAYTLAAIILLSIIDKQPVRRGNNASIFELKI